MGAVMGEKWERFCKRWGGFGSGLWESRGK